MTSVNNPSKDVFVDGSTDKHLTPIGYSVNTSHSLPLLIGIGFGLKYGIVVVVVMCGICVGVGVGVNVGVGDGDIGGPGHGFVVSQIIQCEYKTPSNDSVVTSMYCSGSQEYIGGT